MASNKESEHYLDQLLYSVNGTGDEKTIEEFFLKELEYELESDEYKEYLSDFEMELEEDERGIPPVVPEPVRPGGMERFEGNVPDDEEILKEPELLPDDVRTEEERLKSMFMTQPKRAAEPLPQEPASEEAVSGGTVPEAAVLKEPVPEAAGLQEPLSNAAASAGVAPAGSEASAEPENDSFSVDSLLDQVSTIIDDVMAEPGGTESASGAQPAEPDLSEPDLSEPVLSDSTAEPALSGQQPEDAPELSIEEELGEPDLSGNATNDLLKLLSEEKGLEDLSELLSDDGPIEPENGMDAIQEFAESEMQKQEQAVSGKKGKDSKKKLKFIDRLKNLLFGDDDEDEDDGAERISMSGKEDTVSELSAENQQILKELEMAEAEPPAGKGKKDKKKKDKKEKKEKKPKKEKVKKEKAPKPKKPPKEKKPKEVDNTPPLPKKPVILILFMVASLTALILLGTSFAGYSADIKTAQNAFDRGDYIGAYKSMSGYEIKEQDEKLYHQAGIMAAVYSEYEGYLTFRSNGHQVQAIDCLICAAGRCEVNREGAAQYECTAQLEEVESAIAESLSQDYGLTWEQAIEIYTQKNRTQYTKRLYELVKELGMAEQW